MNSIRVWLLVPTLERGNEYRIVKNVIYKWLKDEIDTQPGDGHPGHAPEP